MKTAMVAWAMAISCMGLQSALAQTEGLPLVTNVDSAKAKPQHQHQQRAAQARSARSVERVERLDAHLSETEMARLDEITTGASARAVLGDEPSGGHSRRRSGGSSKISSPRPAPFTSR